VVIGNAMHIPSAVTIAITISDPLLRFIVFSSKYVVGLDRIFTSEKGENDCLWVMASQLMYPHIDGILHPGRAG
jgi:hypothetical protein